MQHMIIPMAVRFECARSDARERVRNAWRTRHDECGVDEAVTKMIWLAAGIVVALGATAFFVSKYNQAKNSVPDPVGP